MSWFSGKESWKINHERNLYVGGQKIKASTKFLIIWMGTLKTTVPKMLKYVKGCFTKHYKQPYKFHCLLLILGGKPIYFFENSKKSLYKIFHEFSIQSHARFRVLCLILSGGGFSLPVCYLGYMCRNGDVLHFFLNKSWFFFLLHTEKRIIEVFYLFKNVYQFLLYLGVKFQKHFPGKQKHYDWTKMPTLKCKICFWHMACSVYGSKGVNC